uniref:Putative ribonuclease H-like domain-containing protein n=1 Tax=Tanacetum cinerariifolium TaxID=118510 RepID=A0A6L2MHM6_TANCI|nr:putative ribonuclease H-like domain-containing protein [Tanacetum cinerariifolium]
MGVNIHKSIDEGPFKMGKFREKLAEGALHLGPERDRVFADLTLEENKRFKADIRATNILLQGLLFRMFMVDITEAPVQDLELNEDNVFQADQCDAFDFDVYEAPTTQTMFMANLSSTDPIYDEVCPSYDSDILSESAQCVFVNEQNKVVNDSLTTELARYKEQVELYEKGKAITPLDYSKKNYLATFTPQRHLTPEQIFWSEDVHKHLTNGLKPITALTVYLPNTPAKLVPGFFQQNNDIVKRQNRTLVEAARTMLIFSKASIFLWAEAVATTFQVPVVSAGTPSSTTIDQDASSTSHSSSSAIVQPSISHQGVAAGPTIKDSPFAQAEDNPFVNVFTPEPNSEESS